VSERHIARPGGITLLMILGVIQGVIGIAGGIFLILDKDDQTLRDEVNLTSNTLVASGIGLLVAGAIIMLLALRLGSGSNIVRWLYGIVTIVNVGFGVWGLFSLHGEQQMSAAFSTVFGLIVLWILFGSERTDEFFAS
jgi:hypothetical protein